MALGGVATGSMKAKEELRVHGSITYSGLRPMERDWGETGAAGSLAQGTGLRDRLSGKRPPKRATCVPSPVPPCSRGPDFSPTHTRVLTRLGSLCTRNLVSLSFYSAA